MTFNCKYCGSEMNVSILAYKQNSYCNFCFDDRADAMVKKNNIDTTVMHFLGVELIIPCEKTHQKKQREHRHK